MNPQVKQWIDSNYQNFVKKNGASAISKGQLDHIIDWMESPEASRYLARLNRISVPAALELANKWTYQINKANEKLKEQNSDLGGLEVVKRFDDGYFIAKLVSKEAFQKEGVKMGHCVASYYTDSDEVDFEIYSLRDSKNEPHCTIEFTKSNKTIDQIKGKANQLVVEKYHKYVVEFLNNFDFDHVYSYDLKNISSIYFGNYIFLNNQMPKVLEIKKSLKIELVNFIHSFDSLTIKGDAILKGNRRCKKLASTLIVEGDLIVEDFHGLLKLADKLIVKGSVEMVNCENLKLLANTVDAESVYIEDCPHFKTTFKIKGEIEVA